MAAFQDTEDFRAGFADDPVFKEMSPCDYCGDMVALGSMHAVDCITHHEFICAACLPNTVVVS